MISDAHRRAPAGGNSLWSSPNAGVGGEGAVFNLPQYEYKGSGLLDDDDVRGLRKRKTLARKVAAQGVKAVVLVLMVISLGGWLWTHKHKKALHAHLDTTLTNLNAAESDKTRLRRLMSERDEKLKTKEREVNELRVRLERLTSELGNTHSKHSQQSSKLEQNLLNCQGELLVAQNRAVELEQVASEQEQRAADLQQRLDADIHKQGSQDEVQLQEAASLRSELQECQSKLQRSAAGNLDPAFLTEQQRLREQEASAKAKLHASATPENMANWRNHLPPGPAPVTVPATQQAQQQEQPQQQQQEGAKQQLGQQQQQGAQQQPGQQQQQGAQQQPGQQQQQGAQQQPSQQQPQAPQDKQQQQGQPGGQQQAGQQDPQAPQAQQQQQQQQPGQQQVQQPVQQGGQQQQQAAPQQDVPKPTGKAARMNAAQRLREAWAQRRRHRPAGHGHGHVLSQLEQALGHDAHAEHDPHADHSDDGGIEQHPERQFP